MLALEILIILTLMLVNGGLAMSELALVSSRRSRLEQLSRSGSRRAASALRLIDDPGRFLATVQIGITVVAIVAGAFGGATLAVRLSGWLDRFALVAGHGEAMAITLVVAGITYLSLVIGELVPKRIALANPERTASTVAPIMSAISRLAAPAVWLLRLSTDAVLRILGLERGTRSTITEDEVKALIAEGTHAGVFAPREREMIDGVLRLADRSVRQIMTPRTDVVWIDAAASREDAVAAALRARHARLLVCRGSIDQPLGFVHVKDLLPVRDGGGLFDLPGMVEPPLAVHEGTAVLRLLDLLRRDRVHAALVVDEYGALQGLVTLTDVFEAIAGDLPEGEEEVEEPMVRQRADGSWLVDGRLPLGDFASLVGNRELASDPGLHTVAGLVLDQLGHLPEAGEKVRVADLVLEVVDMDGRRIDTVLVTRDFSAEAGCSSGGAR